MNCSACVLVAGVLATAGAASAQLVTSSPYLYGQGRSYQQSGAPTHFVAGGSFFDIFFELDMAGPPIGGPPPGTFHDDPVPTSAAMVVSLNGLPPGVPWEVPPGIMHVGTTGQDATNFQTELLSLILTGGTMPPSVMIRESPTLASSGHTRITDMGGGQFRIDSFFDVFTELSIDGGNSWVPSTNGSAHLNISPAPGTAVLLGFGGLVAARRRRRDSST